MAKHRLSFLQTGVHSNQDKTAANLWDAGKLFVIMMGGVQGVLYCFNLFKCS